MRAEMGSRNKKLPTDTQPPADARERTPLPTQLAAPTLQALTALPAKANRCASMVSVSRLAG
jgi:hypothetical protein